MVASVSVLLFSIVLGIIGAIIVLVLPAVMEYLFKLSRKIPLDKHVFIFYIFSCTTIQEIFYAK